MPCFQNRIALRLFTNSSPVSASGISKCPCIFTGHLHQRAYHFLGSFCLSLSIVFSILTYIIFSFVLYTYIFILTNCQHIWVIRKVQKSVWTTLCAGIITIICSSTITHINYCMELSIKIVYIVPLLLGINL